MFLVAVYNKMSLTFIWIDYQSNPVLEMFANGYINIVITYLNCITKNICDILKLMVMYSKIFNNFVNGQNGLLLKDCRMASKSPWAFMNKIRVGFYMNKSQ